MTILSSKEGDFFKGAPNSRISGMFTEGKMAPRNIHNGPSIMFLF